MLQYAICGDRSCWSSARIGSGNALVLAVVATMAFGSVALAEGPTQVIVNFNGDNPDVTVTAFVPGPGTGCAFSVLTRLELWTKEETEDERLT